MKFKVGDKVRIIGSEINTRVNDNIGKRGVVISREPVMEKIKRGVVISGEPVMEKILYSVQFGREIEGLTYSCEKTGKIFYNFYEDEIEKINNWVEL